jgi:hypothetical protein
MTSTPEAPRYPVWRYHATKPACIVNDEAADRALGAGWVSHPAQLVQADTKKKGPMSDQPTQLPAEPDAPDRPTQLPTEPDHRVIPGRPREWPSSPDVGPHPEQPIAEPPPPARPKKKS